MPYIRTKNGNIIPTNAKYIIAYGKNNIAKLADTIEELCDEFVFIGQDNIPILMESLQDCLDRIKDLGLIDYQIYGAIWIEWGLKYAAKMNEKGKLELL